MPLLNKNIIDTFAHGLLEKLVLPKLVTGELRVML